MLFFFKVWPCVHGVFCVGDIAAKVFFLLFATSRCSKLVYSHNGFILMLTFFSLREQCGHCD